MGREFGRADGKPLTNEDWAALIQSGNEAELERVARCKAEGRCPKCQNGIRMWDGGKKCAACNGTGRTGE